MSIDLEALATKIVEMVGRDADHPVRSIPNVKALLEETLTPKTETREQRLQAFLDLANLHDFVYVQSPLNYINGQFSVSERKDTLKMPLQFKATDLIPDFNLASVNHLGRAKMGVFLTFVDFEK